MSTVITEPTKVQLASIDLAGYDPEQSRLMEERCILVDEQDRVVGASDKKTCECSADIIRRHSCSRSLFA